MHPTLKLGLALSLSAYALGCGGHQPNKSRYFASQATAATTSGTTTDGIASSTDRGDESGLLANASGSPTLRVGYVQKDGKVVWVEPKVVDLRKPGAATKEIKVLVPFTAPSGASSSAIAASVSGGTSTASPTRAPAPLAPSTPGSQTGSRYWYQGNTYGNPLKAHTSQEAAYANQVLDLVNQERAKAGLPPLQADPQAAQAAKAHVEDMAGRDYFSHFTPEGWTPGDRARMLGASGYGALAENIAAGQASPAAAMQAWMASPGHRAAILSPTHTHVGVGVNQAGRLWCLVFMQR